MVAYTRKVKVSVTIDADVLRAVDRLAAVEADTRSGVIQRWLRQGSRLAERARLENDTAAYYDGLTVAERDEDARWAKAATRAVRDLTFDDEPARSSRPAPRRPRRG